MRESITSNTRDRKPQRSLEYLNTEHGSTEGDISTGSPTGSGFLDSPWSRYGTLVEDEEDNFAPEKLDGLIRAGTSLLAILEPLQTREALADPVTEDSNSKLIRLLDRVATLFISRERTEVVCAMMQSTQEEYRLIRTSDEKMGAPQALYTQTDSRVASGDTTPKVTPKDKDFGNCRGWLIKFLEGSFTEIAYAQYLERFTAAYLYANDVSEREDILFNCRAMVILNCLPNLQQRLNVPITTGTDAKFVHLFCNGRFITVDSLVEGFARMDLSYNEQTVSEFDENWFLPKMELLAAISGIVCDNMNRIVLDRYSIGPFHLFVQKVIRMVSALLDELKPFHSLTTTSKGAKSQPLEAAISSATKSLKLLEQYLGVLTNLVFRSETFKKYLRHPRISEALKEITNRAAAVSDDESADLEDEGVILTRDRAFEDPVKAIESWLGTFLQHYVGVRDLLKRARKPIRIITIQPPVIETGTQQASLEELLRAATDQQEKVSRIISELQNRATMKSLDNPGSPWSSLLDPEKWASLFKGKHHTAAMLCCLKTANVTESEETMDSEKIKVKDRKAFKALVKELQLCGNALGISKPCCHLCSRYVQITMCSPGHVTRGTSCRVFPWAPPPWETRIGVLMQLWLDLKDRLYTALSNANLTTRNGRHFGSEDDGISDAEDSKVELERDFNSEMTERIAAMWE